MYILIKNQQLKILISAKELQTNEQMLQGRNYFRYEMKDTNQLMKSLFESKVSESSTKSGEIKEEHTMHTMHSATNEHSNSSRSALEKGSREHSSLDSSALQPHPRQCRNPFESLNSDSQNQDRFCIGELEQMTVRPVKKIKTENQIENFMLQKFYVGDEEDEDDQLFCENALAKSKSKELDDFVTHKLQEGYETRKQRKGLASISLKVKRIVSEHKKLNYKEVSDLVLESSKEEISKLKQRYSFLRSYSQQKKEEKNIKRRVYDALNVLVAVGILGKEHRCVTMTEWTNVPGKKLSKQWQNVNSKIEHLKNLKKRNHEKQEHLNFMLAKYRGMAALEKKNELQDLENSINFTESQQDPILSFPILMFYTNSGDEQEEKLTVQFQDQEEEGQVVKVSGKHMGMIGDLDFATELDLQGYRDHAKEQKLLQDLHNLIRSEEREGQLTKAAAKKSDHAGQSKEKGQIEQSKLKELQNEVNQNHEDNNISKYLNEPFFDED